MKGRIVVDVADDNSMLIQVTKFRTIDADGRHVGTSLTTTNLKQVKRAIASVCKQGKDTIQEIPVEMDTNIVAPELKAPGEA